MTVTLTSDTEHVNSISKQPYKTTIYATIEVAGQRVRFQLVAWATVNVISKADLDPHVPVEPTRGTLLLFDASKLKPLGRCKATVVKTKTGDRYPSDFAVVDKHVSSFLGVI